MNVIDAFWGVPQAYSQLYNSLSNVIRKKNVYDAILERFCNISVGFLKLRHVWMLCSQQRKFAPASL